MSIQQLLQLIGDLKRQGKATSPFPTVLLLPNAVLWQALTSLHGIRTARPRWGLWPLKVDKISVLPLRLTQQLLTTLLFTSPTILPTPPPTPLLAFAFKGFPRFATRSLSRKNILCPLGPDRKTGLPYLGTIRAYLNPSLLVPRQQLMKLEEGWTPD